jgi:shikimate kinase
MALAVKPKLLLAYDIIHFEIMLNKYPLTDQAQNIILTGMPGVGKSTIARLLSIRLKRPFLDTDDLIEARLGLSLQKVIDVNGRHGFYRAEEAAVLSVNCRSHVIATGGSVVYSPQAMAHLKKIGFIVYLEIGLAELKKRLTNFQSRGILKSPGQSLEDLFQERQIMYLKSAQLKIPCSRKNEHSVVDAIISALGLL